MTKYDEPVMVTTDIRLTVERLEALKKVNGGLTFAKTLEAEDEVRLRSIAFLELYRRDTELGERPDPDDLWDRASRVEITFGGPPVRTGFMSEGS
jgi:hypothetical protein